MINYLIHIFFYQPIIVIILASLATVQAYEQPPFNEIEKLGFSNITPVSPLDHPKPLPDQLNDCLVFHIFPKLELNTLGCVAQVCKNWQIQSEHSSIWKSLVPTLLIRKDYTLFMNWDKDNVAAHFLRTKINTMSDKLAIEDMFRQFPRILSTPYFSLRLFIDPILEECAAYKSRLSLLREAKRVIEMVDGQADGDTDKIFGYIIPHDPEARRQSDDDKNIDIRSCLLELGALFQKNEVRGFSVASLNKILDEGVQLGKYQEHYNVIMKLTRGVNGVAPNLDAAYKSICSFAEDDDRLAQYLKAFGMLFGCLGFNKDTEAAHAYIYRHRIAY
ncbi:MAG: F-box-like domain-containing protein [Candidatus Paracaedibacter sp.]